MLEVKNESGNFTVRVTKHISLCFFPLYTNLPYLRFSFSFTSHAPLMISNPLSTWWYNYSYITTIEGRKEGLSAAIRDL